MSECLIYKKPMLVFSIKNHVEQLMNLYTLKEYLEFGNIKDLELSLSLFLKNLDKIRKSIFSAHINGFGAVDVVDIIEETLKE